MISASNGKNSYSWEQVKLGTGDMGRMTTVIHWDVSSCVGFKGLVNLIPAYWHRGAKRAFVSVYLFFFFLRIRKLLSWKALFHALQKTTKTTLWN